MSSVSDLRPPTSGAASAIHDPGFDQAPIAMALVTLDGRWQRANRRLCRLLGIPPDLGGQFGDIVHPADRSEYDAVRHRLLADDIEDHAVEGLGYSPEELAAKTWAELTHPDDLQAIPSQLNQVFMNLLVNAAQAMDERGRISIRTGCEGTRVWIEIAGTGLGLSLSWGIVQRHKGTIAVRSESGQGTTFRITLPVDSGAADVPQQHDAA